MAFSVKDWKDFPDTSTPISQAALEDMETRLSNFSASSAGTYRNLTHASTLVAGTLASGNYVWISSASQIASGSNASLPALGVIYIASADYALSGLTTKLRVRAEAFTNTTGPGVTYTVGLYPISSVTGSSTTVSQTLGTVTTGSTVPFASPAASTRSQANSGDFSLPSDGWYVLGLNSPGGASASSTISFTAHLQIHYV